MIGNSVVPGLPNRWVMPSSLSSARKAERPVMRFFMFPPRPTDVAVGWRHHADPARQCNGGGSWLHCAGARGPSIAFARELEGIFAGGAALLLRALPDHAGIAFQRHQRLAGVGPFLQLLDGKVIERLAARAAREQGTRDVHHVRRAGALVEQRRAAGRAEAARGLRGRIVIARDRGLAPGDAKALAPASDIGGVGRPMRAAAWS